MTFLARVTVTASAGIIIYTHSLRKNVTLNEGFCLTMARLFK